MWSQIRNTNLFKLNLVYQHMSSHINRDKNNDYFYYFMSVSMMYMTDDAKFINQE